MRSFKLFVLCFFMFLSLPLSAQTAHVLVALCDNKYQGIAPVPAALGKGDDPKNNLYWGAMYGARAFLRKSPDWELVEEIKKPSKIILVRSIFRNKNTKDIVILDAYNGKNIKEATAHFFDYTAGLQKQIIKAGEGELPAGGGADFIVYLGHNGLMDFSLKSYPKGAAGKLSAVFACYSKHYFEDKITAAGGKAAVLTKSKMAPEGYVLEAVLNAWTQDKTCALCTNAAAQAYSKYQKISLKAARTVF